MGNNKRSRITKANLKPKWNPKTGLSFYIEKNKFEVRGKLVDTDTQQVIEERVYATCEDITDALYIVQACKRYPKYPSSDFYVQSKQN